MFTKVSLPKMEQQTLACLSLFVLGTNLIQGTSGATDVSNAVTLPTDSTNTSATDDTAATNLTATDNTNLTETTDDVVFVKYLGMCCWYDNAVCAGNGTVCSSCICRCERNYVFNQVSMTCEAMGGQKSGDRLPGQPCTSASQCVEGLVCNSTTCACPWPCVYMEKHLVCDCGESENPLTGPIVCGLVLGFLIVMFWCTRIYYVIYRYKEQNKVSRLSTSVSGISTLGAAYGTDHITIRPQTHSLAHVPSCPRPHNQTVAPLSPATFRYQPGPQVEAARSRGQNYQAPSATPPHRLDTPTSSLSHQVFGSDNPAYEFSNGPLAAAGGPQPASCPASAPEDRKSASNSVSKASVPPMPDLTQPSRSARF